MANLMYDYLPHDYLHTIMSNLYLSLLLLIYSFGNVTFKNMVINFFFLPRDVRISFRLQKLTRCLKTRRGCIQITLTAQPSSSPSSSPLGKVSPSHFLSFTRTLLRPVLLSFSELFLRRNFGQEESLNLADHFFFSFDATDAVWLSPFLAVSAGLALDVLW